MAIVDANGNKVEEKAYNVKFPRGSAEEEKIASYCNRNDISGTQALRNAIEDLFLLDTLIDERVADYASANGMNREAFLRAAVEAMLANG